MLLGRRLLTLDSLLLELLPASFTTRERLIPLLVDSRVVRLFLDRFVFFAGFLPLDAMRLSFSKSTGPALDFARP